MAATGARNSRLSAFHGPVGCGNPLNGYPHCVRSIPSTPRSS
jgi:hypothetical protein